MDAFILAHLREQGLKPSPAADRRTLIRRVYYDLVGLPPSPTEVHSFVEDSRPDAYARLIDRLLDSPSYGERWARHWMDAVRYAETHGHDEDAIREHAWPYRDYLIRAFNADLPYAQFVREQVAGDVIAPNDPWAVVATAFLACGPWDESSQMGIQDGTIDKEIARYLDRDEMITATLSTFASTTAHCARCHDHKFDPISLEDYYALQAVFAGVDRVERPLPGGPAGSVATGDYDAPAADRIYAVASEFEPQGNFKPAVKPRVVHVLRRGSIDQPGGVARPGALEQLELLDSDERFEVIDSDDEGQRRRALADWLAHPDNVLTWRSIVNRVWYHHFGRGLAASLNDFGYMGEPPTHPELLDWLAWSFREHGGSLKWLHRIIVTSALYRQASDDIPEMSAVDADNRFYWRMTRRRLDAESLRDGVLAMAGRLDRRMGGPSDRQFLLSKGVHITPNLDYEGFDADAPANFRRSVYRFVFRTVPDPLMRALDCPDASQLTPVRASSVNPLQALALMNDGFMIRSSELLAARLEQESNSLEGCIRGLVERAYGRAPEAWEIEALRDFAERHGLANACRLVLNSSEYAFVN